jgi:hypothetical protein
MPTTKARIDVDPKVMFVPTKSFIISSRGRLAAATAIASARLVTIPVCRRVASAADATPKRYLGAAFIAALLFGEKNMPPPSPIRESASAMLA